MYPYLIQDDNSQPPADFADRYQILSVLGQGAFGVVYKARHSLMGRTVAIKVLHEEMPDSMLMRRFQVEAQAASNLSHPNIVTVYDFGTSSNNQLYLVMDFVEGTDLDETLQSEGRLAVQRALNIFIQACDALEHAHHRGVIHRDLKPSNIMLATTDGAADTVKIVDFGLAKLAAVNAERLTATGDLLGTPLYMSPEQCLGEPLDPRSDIYALGCIMYRVLTGHLPIEGKNILATLYQQISAPPVPFEKSAPGLQIPACVEKIVLKALQKDPAARYQSMAELGAELRSVQNALTSGKRQNAVLADPDKRRSAKILFGSAAVIALVIAFMAPTAHVRSHKRVVRSVEPPVQTVQVQKPKPQAKVVKSSATRTATAPRIKTAPNAVTPPTRIVTAPELVPVQEVEPVVEPVAEPEPQLENDRRHRKIRRLSKVVGTIADHYLHVQPDQQVDPSAAPTGKLGRYREILQDLLPQQGFQ
jgi:serine/threonine protein kinase